MTLTVYSKINFIFLLWGFCYGVVTCAPLKANLDLQRVVYQSFVVNENTIQCYGNCLEYRDPDSRKGKNIKFTNSQCEGKNLNVKCNPGYHIHVTSALLGILNPDLDICNAMVPLRCPYDVTREVSKKCNLSTICTLDVLTHAMMRACSASTYWSMDIKYRCNSIASVTTKRGIDEAGHYIANTMKTFVRKTLILKPYDSITNSSRQKEEKYIRKTKSWFLVAYNTITTNEFIKKNKTQLLIILFITFIFGLTLWTCCFYESCKTAMQMGRNLSQILVKPDMHKEEVIHQFILPIETAPLHKASPTLYTHVSGEGDDICSDTVSDMKKKLGLNRAHCTCIRHTSPESCLVSDKSSGSLSCLPTETSISSNDEQRAHDSKQYYYPRQAFIHNYKISNRIDEKKCRCLATGSVKSCDVIKGRTTNGSIRSKKYREKYKAVHCGRKKKTKRRGRESGYMSHGTTTDCSGGLSTDEDECRQFIPPCNIRNVTKCCYSMPCHLHSHCVNDNCLAMIPIRGNNQSILENSLKTNVLIPHRFNSTHYSVKSCERDLSCHCYLNKYQKPLSTTESIT